MSLLPESVTRESILAFLNLRILPARLDSRASAAVLGFEEYQVGILVSAKILTPLGKPAINGPKWFATSYILALHDNKDWLNKATLFLQKHNKRINDKRLKEAVQD